MIKIQTMQVRGIIPAGLVLNTRLDTSKAVPVMAPATFDGAISVPQADDYQMITLEGMIYHPVLLGSFESDVHPKTQPANPYVEPVITLTNVCFVGEITVWSGRDIPIHSIEFTTSDQGYAQPVALPGSVYVPSSTPVIPVGVTSDRISSILRSSHTAASWSAIDVEGPLYEIYGAGYLVPAKQVNVYADMLKGMKQITVQTDKKVPAVGYTTLHASEIRWDDNLAYLQAQGNVMCEEDSNPQQGIGDAITYQTWMISPSSYKAYSLAVGENLEIRACV